MTARQEGQLPGLLSWLDGTVFEGAHTLLCFGEGGGLKSPDLRNPAALAVQLQRFAVKFSGPDRAALASVWSKEILRAWAVPVIAAEIGRGVRIWHRHALFIRCDASGRPDRVWLPAPVPGGDFQMLITDGFSPFVKGVAAASGCPERVLWGNIGNLFEALTVLARERGRNMPGLASAEAILAERHLPGGTRNPLWQPIRYSPDLGGGQARRQRRVCCLRDRLNGQSLCATCPGVSRPCFVKENSSV